MDLVGVLHQFPIWELYHVERYYIDIFKHKTTERFSSVVHKSLLSSQLSSLYGALYKPSDMVDLVKRI